MANFAITVDALTNYPPDTLGDKSIAILNKNTYVFLQTDFTNTIPAYSDPEGDIPAKVKIVTLPTGGGQVQYNSIAVTLNQEILWADVLAGLLTYRANQATDLSYSDIVGFDLADVGSNTFSGLTGNINFTIGAYVNQPPSNVGDNATTVGFNDTYVFTLEDFTTETAPPYSDPEGDSASLVRITGLPNQGALKLNGVVITLNKIISIADIIAGNFTFVAFGNVAGYSTSFTFSIADSGSGQFVS